MVTNWFHLERREANTRGLLRVLEGLGIQTTYQFAHRTLQGLKAQLVESDSSQYGYLRSYTAILNTKSHCAVLEEDGRVFQRVVVIYWPGIQAFGIYRERGLQLDGTFIKCSTGGTLLIACFKDGNYNIFIIAAGVVSGENEDNWKWFLQHLKAKMEHSPSFIVSDREKGLLKAVATVFTGVPHFYCFRHVMEIFNSRFKS